jgi:molybdopterin converting factor small subunit
VRTSSTGPPETIFNIIKHYAYISKMTTSTTQNTTTEELYPPKQGTTNEKTEKSASFTIHYFASASQYTGKHTETLPAPLPLSDLFNSLEDKYPGIKDKVLKSCGVSVGEEYIIPLSNDQEGQGDGEDAWDGEGMIIEAGVEVAIIPPVSSG